MNDRIMKSLMAGIQELTSDPGVGRGARSATMTRNRKCLIVLKRVETRSRSAGA